MSWMYNRQFWFLYKSKHTLIMAVLHKRTVLQIYVKFTGLAEYDQNSEELLSKN